MYSAVHVGFGGSCGAALWFCDDACVCTNTTAAPLRPPLPPPLSSRLSLDDGTFTAAARPLHRLLSAFALALCASPKQGQPLFKIARQTQHHHTVYARRRAQRKECLAVLTHLRGLGEGHSPQDLTVAVALTVAFAARGCRPAKP